jgi:hypothetical protein
MILGKRGDSMVVMKWVVGLLVASSWLWAADQPKDREAIVKLVASLNDAKTQQDPNRPDIARALETLNKGVAEGIWSEMSRPIIISRSVEFLAPKVARVEAARVQNGAVNSRSVPIIIMLERENRGWVIRSLRIGAEPPPPIRPVRFLPQ